MKVEFKIYTKTLFGESDGYLYQDTKVIGELPKTNNFKQVKIRSSKSCGLCRSSILEGDNCFTVNNKFKGRKWFCSDCTKFVVPSNVEGKVIGRFLDGQPLPFVNKVHETIGYPSKFEAEFLYYVSGNNSDFLDVFLEDYVDSLNELTWSYDVLSDF